MSEQQNIEIVKRGYEAFGHGDMQALLGLFDEQIEWIASGTADLPTSGRRTGRQQVAEFFTAVNDTFEIQRFEPREFIAQGDRVVVTGIDVSKVRATGKVIEGEWAHIFTVRDGKVVRFQEYQDTAQAVVELRAAKAAVQR